MLSIWSSPKFCRLGIVQVGNHKYIKCQNITKVKVPIFTGKLMAKLVAFGHGHLHKHTQKSKNKKSEGGEKRESKKPHTCTKLYY